MAANRSGRSWSWLPSALCHSRLHRFALPSGTASSRAHVESPISTIRSGTVPNPTRAARPVLRERAGPVRATTPQVKALAPVLNAPFVTSRWRHSPGTKAMVKWQGGHFYVFAGSAEQRLDHRARSPIPCVGNASATVLGERNRRSPVRRGRSADSFADGNAVHIYRIDGGSACGLKRRS